MERRIIVLVPSTGQRLEVVGVLAEMVVLLLSRATEVRAKMPGRVRFTYWIDGVRMYGPERQDKDDAA